MRDRDERSSEKTTTTPKGLEGLSERIQVTLWLSNQLNLLDRVKPSNRLNSLKSELREILDSSEFQTYENLSASILRLKADVSSLESQLKNAKSELEKRPIREIVKYETPSELSLQPGESQPVVSTFPRAKWVIAVIIIIVVISVIHQLHLL
jgi:hypothetical protein